MNSEHKTVSKKIRTKLNDTEFLNINISHGSLFLGTMFGVVLSLLAGSDRIQFTLIRRKTRSDNTCEWVCCDEVEQWSTGWIPDLQAVLKAAVSWCNRFAEVSRDGRDGMPYWRRDPGKPSPFFNISWRKTPEEAARQLLIVDTPESQPGKCAMCGHAHDAGNCAQCPCTTFVDPAIYGPRPTPPEGCELLPPGTGRADYYWDKRAPCWVETTRSGLPFTESVWRARRVAATCTCAQIGGRCKMHHEPAFNGVVPGVTPGVPVGVVDHEMLRMVVKWIITPGSLMDRDKCLKWLAQECGK